MLSEQLAAADLATRNPAFDGLLGLSELPGSTAVNDACESALGAYSGLYSKIVWAQTVLRTQLDTMAANITETHQLYQDVEAKQEHLFRGMSEMFAEPTAGGD